MNDRLWRRRSFLKMLGWMGAIGVVAKRRASRRSAGPPCRCRLPTASVRWNDFRKNAR